MPISPALLSFRLSICRAGRHSVWYRCLCTVKHVTFLPVTPLIVTLGMRRHCTQS